MKMIQGYIMKNVLVQSVTEYPQKCGSVVTIRDSGWHEWQGKG
jgi:hypothetical protein